MSKTKLILSLSVLLVATLACNFIPATQASKVAPTQDMLPTLAAMTSVVEPTSATQPNRVPLTEAEVPRVPLEQAKAAIDSGAAIVVDVRPAESYKASHIPGAISIPLADIEANPTGLKLDKNQWIITYCTWLNEHTSARAAFVMLNNGYTHVTPILGGLTAWVDAGYPVEP